MADDYTANNFSRIWGLSFEELSFLLNFPTSIRLEAAVQLKFLCAHGQYALSWDLVSEDAVTSEVLTAMLRDLPDGTVLGVH